MCQHIYSLRSIVCTKVTHASYIHQTTQSKTEKPIWKNVNFYLIQRSIIVNVRQLPPSNQCHLLALKGFDCHHKCPTPNPYIEPIHLADGLSKFSVFSIVTFHMWMKAPHWSLFAHMNISFSHEFRVDAEKKLWHAMPRILWSCLGLSDVSGVTQPLPYTAATIEQ